MQRRFDYKAGLHFMPRLCMKHSHQISWSIYTFYTNTFYTNAWRLAHQHLLHWQPLYTNALHDTTHASGPFRQTTATSYVAENPTQFTDALPQKPPPLHLKLNHGFLARSQDVLITTTVNSKTKILEVKQLFTQPIQTTCSAPRTEPIADRRADHVHHKSLLHQQVQQRNSTILQINGK